MTDHQCPDCDRAFDTHFDFTVHHTEAHETKLPNRRCEHCDSYFRAPHQQKYCSEQCRDEAVSFAGEDNPNYRGGRDTTTCDLCGDEFEFYPSEKSGLYCPTCVETKQWRTTPVVEKDDNPLWNGGKRVVTCEICGSEEERWPSEIVGVTVCSETCRRQWLSEAFTGEGHPNWTGGGEATYGKGWNAVRRRALERDGHRCRRCGATKDELGREPDVHHIVPVRWFEEAAFLHPADAHTLDNVISLCISCHRKADFGKVPRDQLRSLIDSVRAED